MKAYELLFFVNPALDPETRLAVMKRIDTTIAEGNGTVDKVDEWGKRKLAYEINDLTEGDYTLINFHADPAQIAELDRVLRITDAVERPRSPHHRCGGASHDRSSRRHGVNALEPVARPRAATGLCNVGRGPSPRGSECT